MRTIGIDLGTTNCLAAVWQNGESVLIPDSSGEYLTPSFVSVGWRSDLCRKDGKGADDRTS